MHTVQIDDLLLAGQTFVFTATLQNWGQVNLHFILLVSKIRESDIQVNKFNSIQ